MQIIIDEEIQQACPDLMLNYFSVPVSVQASNEGLLALIEQKCVEIEQNIPLDSISQLPPIHAAREAYKALGKKPGRYRPSAEALLRRVVTGKGLYRINNVVDLINYISISSQFSIGGYDADQIEGQIRLGKGKTGEPYEAIARGQLNIANLPVLRDEKGAFGCPTSDSTRTMVDKRTKKLLMVFFNFGGDKELEGAFENFLALFHNFCSI